MTHKHLLFRVPSIPRRVSDQKRRHPLVVVLSLSACLVTLTGCSLGATKTPTITTGTSPASNATPSAPPTPSSTPDATPPPNAGSTPPSSSGTAPSRCTADHLTGATATNVKTDTDVNVLITLTNTGNTDCTLQGWPGVSVVGGENGTQLGRAANLDRTAPHPTVMLKPTTQAQFTVRIFRPLGDSNAECHPRIADGFRVYPPGSTESVFVEAPGYVACASDQPTNLTTGAVLPGSAK